ncbi:hypothetical protein GNI_015250 [Gregarina niphandrodes]|uniref:WD domain, G-beta repeat protein n=1 Tax=Gregarina niphandrodes TaxID=110365 RepID=A0A023BCN1_GRENI|nr:hypothetical protein GNI_015250 [Gregarina niphandrodes]EZG83079.1 hypothetical protein GNI_015250 [Gregarina niphandrodes]|eukprot:XP_011128960.1 hypothetical protein GNI_015250 [Gregarina niphandrodes]
MDGFVRVYDIRKSLVREHFLHSGVNGLATSPEGDGMCFGASCLGGKLYLIDNEEGTLSDIPTHVTHDLSKPPDELASEVLNSASIADNFNSDLLTLAFSPDGELLCVPASNGQVYGWNTLDRNVVKLKSPGEAQGHVNGILFVRDNLATWTRIDVLGKRDESSPRKNWYLSFDSEGILTVESFNGPE